MFIRDEMQQITDPTPPPPRVAGEKDSYGEHDTNAIRQLVRAESDSPAARGGRGLASVPVPYRDGEAVCYPPRSGGKSGVAGEARAR